MRETERKRDVINENFNLRNRNGITLVALIVTIIVLLLLVGVTISMITGEKRNL